MGYDWEDKKDLCYRLYVDEKKSLDDVVDYFRTRMDFVPSKRTFQTQFRRWGFPTKLDYSHKDEAVVQRVRDMWERNVMQKDMLPILQAEGYNVTESGLMRLRFRHGMHLKSANMVRSALNENATQQVLAPDAANETSLVDTSAGDKRKDREEELRVSNEQKWKAKKRRRHTKEWNGMPADPPGPPRYPSETTIGEAQKFLGLDDEMYREVRNRFNSICDDRDIVKKTSCGPERWAAAKETLIQEYPYLQQLFLASAQDMLAPLQLSLDIICMDVTKHIRTQSKTMTLAEAKNTLGLNPLEARILKQKLINILMANNFINTYESDNWSDLKDEWLQGTAVKARMPTEEGCERERFLKAVQLLCRDTLKRWREAQRKVQGDPGDNSLTVDQASPASKTPRRQTKSPRKPGQANVSAQVPLDEAQIDPFLLEAANTSSFVSARQQEQQQQQERHQQQQQQEEEENTQGGYPTPGVVDASMHPPLPVYFRKSGTSNDAGVPSLWLGVLTSRTVDGLRNAALMNVASGPGRQIVKLEGAVPSAGAELLYQIDQDEELHGYLLSTEGSKATFIVHFAAAA